MRIESDILKTGGILVLMAAAFVVAVWLPHQEQVNTLREQMQQKREQWQQMAVSVKQTEAVRQKVAKLQEEFDARGRAIPVSGDVSPLLRQLSAELAAAQLTDSEIKSEAVVSGADLTVIPLTLHIRGPYDRIFDFVRAVEAGDRLVRVHRLEVSGSPHKPEESVAVRMELSTFASTEGTR